MDKAKQLQLSERRLNYHIVKGWADPKTFNKSPEQWWPIAGEKITKMRRPSKAKLIKANEIFKNLGKNV